MRPLISSSLSILAALMLLAGCSTPPARQEVELDIPRGYVPMVQFVHERQLLFFGPFKGYYFKPVTPGDLSRLQFVCFNVEGFWTEDLPVNAKLYEGEAVRVTLATQAVAKPEEGGRIRPVFFDAAPAAWLAQRPHPQDEFLHFHSCYNSVGAVYTGYWLRHEALTAFTYDMGGRLEPASILYHKVSPGVDKNIAQAIEFDQGPGNPGPRS